MTATMQLLAKLETAEGWPPEHWAEILDQTAKLFFCSTENLSTDQIAIFDDVFLRLMQRVDTPSLAKLSRRLSEAKCSLPKVTRRLAFDKNESVSLLVLKSQGIAQELLLEVIQTQGSNHRFAIASRHSVDPAVSEALIQCENPVIHRALAGNLGAKMFDTGWVRLAEFGEKDLELAEKLARRSDTPAPLKRKLQAKLEDARMRALNAMPRVMRDQIEETVASNKAAIEMLPPPESPAFTTARAKMADLNRKGKLNDSTVNRFAVFGEYVEVAGALAFLTGSPIEVIRSLIASDKVEGLVLACKAARLNWTTATAIVMHRPGSSPVSAGELEKARKTFETISLSAAQRTVRF